MMEIPPSSKRQTGCFSGNRPLCLERVPIKWTHLIAKDAAQNQDSKPQQPNAGQNGPQQHGGDDQLIDTMKLNCRPNEHDIGASRAANLKAAPPGAETMKPPKIDV
jgi:hypothetical protein